MHEKSVVESGETGNEPVAKLAVVVGICPTPLMLNHCGVFVVVQVKVVLLPLTIGFEEKEIVFTPEAK